MGGGLEFDHSSSLWARQAQVGGQWIGPTLWEGDPLFYVNLFEFPEIGRDLNQIWNQPQTPTTTRPYPHSFATAWNSIRCPLLDRYAYSRALLRGLTRHNRRHQRSS